MSETREEPVTGQARRGPSAGPDLRDKLWLYTNFDCNLSCRYCVSESTPTAPRRALGMAAVRRLIDEAAALGFRSVLLTGGEPFLLEEVADMLAYASARMRATVLTNATLFNVRRLDALRAIANERLLIQVSLDGGRPAHHDPYRGAGTWARTVEGIERLLAAGLRIAISTTETPANAAHLDELHDFRRGLGIDDGDHFVRPMARRGFAQEGVDVGMETLVPEVTVTSGGVYWHPLISPRSDDMRVSDDVFPLEAGVACIEKRLAAAGGGPARQAFT